MAELLSKCEPRSRKDHICDAYKIVIDHWNYGYPLTYTELRHIVMARKNKGLIKKGDIYLKQNIKDGNIYTFRAIPEMYNICVKYDMFYD
jgi:hypothetical protein